MRIISSGTPRTIDGLEYLDQSLDKSKIVAFSGDSGIYRGGRQPEHLHLEIARIIGRVAQPPGVDPFQAGIDAKKPFGEYGGRPVYWDCKTEIVATIFEKRGKLKLQESLDTLAKRVRESDLDNVTQEEILKRHNNAEDLRDYLGSIVLMKNPGKDGKPGYRYLPGTLAYALMLEIFPRVEITRQGFVAMLPFISPLQKVKEIYQKANPDVKF